MFIFHLFQDPAYFISVVVIVIISITVHELFHALGALSQGDDTAALAGRITLDPRAHISQSALILLMLFGIAWGSTPVKESKIKTSLGRAWVSFAGPLANLLLMVVSIWGVLLLKHFSAKIPAGLAIWQGATIDFLWLAALLNAVLFLLNMLPVPPLDGFHILETFVPILRRYSFSLSQYGFFILIVLFLVLGLGGKLFALAELMVWKVAHFSLGIIPSL